MQSTARQALNLLRMQGVKKGLSVIGTVLRSLQPESLQCFIVTRVGFAGELFPEFLEFRIDIAAGCVKPKNRVLLTLSRTDRHVKKMFEFSSWLLTASWHPRVWLCEG